MTAIAAAGASDHVLAALPTDTPRGVDGDQRQLLIALAAALALHLLPLAAGVSWQLLGGGRSEVGVGDPAGKEGGVNVEVIDAAEFDKRFVSYGKGRDAIDSEAAPPEAQPPPAPQQQPAEASQPADASPEPQTQAEPVTPLRETRDTPGPERPAKPPPTVPQPTPPQKTAATRPPSPPSPPSQFTEADIAEILDTSKAQLRGEVMLSSAASGARLGEASEYVRGVMRKLKATMPRSNGQRGTVVVGIVLGGAGEVAWAGVIKSSLLPQLDKLVVERVRATRFEPPPPGAPDRERTFQVTYVYN